jgi:hypothetical protein
MIQLAMEKVCSISAGASTKAVASMQEIPRKTGDCEPVRGDSEASSVSPLSASVEHLRIEDAASSPFIKHCGWLRAA